MNAPAIEIKPITEEIETFLGFLGEGLTTLASISNTNGNINAKTFHLPQEIDAAAAWAFDQNTNGNGVYWTVNPSKSRLNKKPKKSDIAYGRLLHRDIDPSKDATIPYATRRDGILRQIEMFKQIEPVPSLIIDSGHGCYPIYLLNQPADCDITEKACRNLGKADHDGTWTINQLLRMPGTINWPSENKINHYGYPKEPAMCLLVFTSDNRYAVEDFLPTIDFTDIPSSLYEKDGDPIIIEDLPLKLQVIIKNGTEVGTRSEKFHYAVLELSRLGYANNQITSLLASWPEGIASKYIDRLDKEVNRCLSKTSPNPDENRDELLKLIDDHDATVSVSEILKKIATSPLGASDQYLLLKKLSVKTGIPLSTLKSDLKGYEKSESCSEDLNSAKLTIDFLGKENLLFIGGSLWRWSDEGLWKRTEEREIKKIIHTVSNSKRITSAFVNSVLELIKTEVNDPSVILDQETSNISCKNGDLVYSDEKDEWTLIPHNRSLFRTTQIPIVYDPNAEAPRFRQFLREVFEGDSDQEAKIAVVEEALGYSLTTSTQFERFFMLIGSGANGKSVLLSVLYELLGKNQVCAVQPSSFDNPFQRAHLFGKLANVITEIAQNGVISDDKLKAFTSGELTTAEEKFKPPFDFKPYAKHWFGTNHLPHTRDFSPALFRRAMVLTFNNKFDGAKRDVHLIKKLKQELPGIFNLALAGLARLIKNGDFTSCPSSDKAKDDWRKEADQVSQFVDDVCKTGNNFSEQSSTLFHAYQYWVDQEGIRHPLNHVNFTKRLALLGFFRKKGKHGTRMIAGLKIREGEDLLS